MNFKVKTLIQKIIQATASLKLAVVVILLLGTISAVGTLVESRYDAITAQKLVYHSSYMYATIALLCINLIGVMVDRWPWRFHHMGFVFAHTGIIITILGAWLTKEHGIDGSLQIPVGEKNRFVILPQEELSISSAFLGTPMEILLRKEVDFLTKPPERYPLVYPLEEGNLHVRRYWPYAVPRERMIHSKDHRGGPAVRIQLFNDKISETHWLWLKRQGEEKSEVNLGPAKVILAPHPYTYTENGNAIVLEVVVNEKSLALEGDTGKPASLDGGKPASLGGDSGKSLALEAETRSVQLLQSLRYQIHSQRRGGLLKKGKVTPGDIVDTGWRMDLQLRVISFLPSAQREYLYEKRERPLEGMTTPAIEIEYRGDKRWLGLGAITRYFLENRAYIVSYRRSYLRLPFDLELRDFRVGRYKGSMRAASYESDVFIKGFGEVTISMNQPLKYQGLTFYQSSFQEAESGRPYISIFSVNHDPGRYIKYFGCFLVVLGSILLFYLKRRKMYPSKVHSPKVYL